MRNALSFLKLFSLAEEDIKNGNTHSEEEVFDALEALLNSPCHGDFGFEKRC